MSAGTFTHDLFVFSHYMANWPRVSIPRDRETCGSFILFCNLAQCHATSISPYSIFQKLVIKAGPHSKERKSDFIFWWSVKEFVNMFLKPPERRSIWDFIYLLSLSLQHFLRKMFCFLTSPILVSGPCMYFFSIWSS